MDELTIVCSRPLLGKDGVAVAFQLLCCDRAGKLYTITPLVGDQAEVLPVRLPKVVWKEAGS